MKDDEFKLTLPQFYAHMEKLAEAPAWMAAQSGKLFSKVTIYGLLVSIVSSKAKLRLPR